MARVDRLDSIENHLRGALISDSFSDADSLLSQYVNEAEREIRGLTVGSDQMRQLEVRTHRLFEWIGAMAQSSRAGTAAELTRLKGLTGYGRPADAANLAGIKA